MRRQRPAIIESFAAQILRSELRLELRGSADRLCQCFPAGSKLLRARPFDYPTQNISNQGPARACRSGRPGRSAPKPELCRAMTADQLTFGGPRYQLNF